MRQTMEQHKAEYRAQSLSRRLGPVFAEEAIKAEQAHDEWEFIKALNECPTPLMAKAYKPVHGGYPG